MTRAAQNLYIMVALRKESVDRNHRGKSIGVPSRVALRKESVDRNSGLANILVVGAKSLSARRAWIEIGKSHLNTDIAFVALRKESVDRNVAVALTVAGLRVALRKESVDRNTLSGVSMDCQKVALRKESVDRNICVHLTLFIPIESLSARRAWIEISNWMYHIT